MVETSRGATLVARSKIEIREYPIPDIPPDGGLLKVEVAGVCGTDVKYYHGTIARQVLPIVLGHEIMGQVVKLGKEAAAIHGVKAGDRVILKGSAGCGRCPDCQRGAPRFCRNRDRAPSPSPLIGGFADYLYIRPTVLLTKVPDTLSSKAAVLVGGVMVNGFQWAIRMGGVKMGDYVLIQGPGQQGLACTYAARHAGAARILVSGLSRDAQRLELAKRFGAQRTVVTDEEDVVSVVRQETGGAMADVVIDVSGSPRAIASSVDCVRRQGTLVLAGLTGDVTVTPMLMDKLVWNEVRLQGAFTAANDAVEPTMRLLAETRFPVEQMVSHVFPLEETERCIQAVGGEVPGLYPTKALIKP